MIIHIYKIARLIQERSREFAVLESMDGGKPIRESRDVDLPQVSANFFYYAGWADKLDLSWGSVGLKPYGVAGQIIPWNKWPLTIHSAAWGLIFNIIGATVISFITQELKETKTRKRIHEFISEYKNYSLTRRSLKPSAWIILTVWIFFSFGPGLMIGNELFGKPINVESWSFGMPSIWVWQVIFWGIGVLLVWFLAVKMEMSSSLEKNIVSQTEDINNT